MSRFALGWDVHRKFSKVSLQEMTTEGQIEVIERWQTLEHRFALPQPPDLGPST